MVADTVEIMKKSNTLSKLKMTEVTTPEPFSMSPELTENWPHL